MITRKTACAAAILAATLSTIALSTAASAAEKAMTDEKGMTLYTFDKDTADKSNCYGDCAKNWPPYLAAKGAKEKKGWKIIERKDGKAMWSYDGKPLYTFIRDAKKGDVTGDGVGGVWHVAQED